MRAFHGELTAFRAPTGLRAAPGRAIVSEPGAGSSRQKACSWRANCREIFSWRRPTGGRANFGEP